MDPLDAFMAGVQDKVRGFCEPRCSSSNRLCWISQCSSSHTSKPQPPTRLFHSLSLLLLKKRGPFFLFFFSFLLRPLDPDPVKKVKQCFCLGSGLG